MVRIVDKHATWALECVVELCSVTHVAMQDMQNLRVCYEGAKEGPLHLEMGVPVHVGMSCTLPVLEGWVCTLLQSCSITTQNVHVRMDCTLPLLQGEYAHCCSLAR